jgi:nucleoside-triphosphatase THEP1
MMKILLTGKPQSGKTTLLTALLKQVADKRGFVTNEVREQGRRVCFNLQDNAGNTALLAHANKPTPYPAGRFFVDVRVLDNFVGPLFQFGPQQLLYIDEIAQMQLYSQRFKELAAIYLRAGNHFLGTITSVYEDEFVKTIKARQDILLCEVTPENRAKLEQGLACLLHRRDMFGALPPAVQQAVIAMGTSYLQADDYVRFKKLFKNAILYVAKGRIHREGGGYLVKGLTHDHHVRVTGSGTMTCDCDLFQGRAEFTGMQGECSHIQAVTLLALATSAGNV